MGKNLLSGLHVFLCAISDISAQNFEQMPLEQGLAQRSVVCFFQDSRGFLWFGTKNGLSRYDGYNFLMFRHDPDNPHSLSHNYVTSIYEDASGDLWIGTLRGLNKLVLSGVEGSVVLYMPG